MTRVLRAFVIALVVVLLPASSQAPPQPVAALAPIEIFVDGGIELVGVVVADDGAVYVSDRSAGVVYRQPPSGSLSVVLSGLDHPAGLLIDPEGRLVLTEEGAGRVLRRESNGSLTVMAAALKSPRSLARGGDGSLYISVHGVGPPDRADDAEGREIVRLAPDGTLVTVATGIRQLEGLAVVAGELIASTQGLDGSASSPGALLRYPILSDGRLGPPRVWIDSDVKEPGGLVVDALGSVYVSAKDAGGSPSSARRVVGKAHRDSRVSAFAMNLDDPHGVAVGPDGSLYLADGRSGRLFKFHAPAPGTLSPLPRFTNHSPLTISGTTEPGARVDAVVEDGAPANALADASGAFAVALELSRNAENHVHVYATPHGGDGLTSASADTVVVHDDQPPDIAILQPVSNGFVGSAIPISARGADRGSGVASITLALDSRMLAAIANPTPTPSFTASMSLDTRSTADGAYTLSATATDAAGNAATTGRSLIVDNTPPDTEIVSATTQETTTTFTFRGTDNLTPPASLVFAWRLDGGVWSAFSASTTVTLTVTGGAHTFEVKARDLAGNEDPTPATRSFRTGGVSVTITEPANGATVSAGRLLVRGTVGGGSGEAGVAVNGFVAAVDGQSFAIQIPVTIDVVTLLAVATTVDGTSVSQEIAITVVPPAGARQVLSVTPASGVAPLTVQFKLSGVASTTVSLDLDGDGVADFVGTTLDGQRFTYAQPGLYVARVTMRDAVGAESTATVVVHVETPAAATARFQDLWSGFKTTLRAGDVPGALAYLSPKIRPDFQRIFGDLGSDLPAVATSLENLVVLEELDDLAETALVRVRDGRQFLYFIYFRRDGRGQWLIEEM